MLKHLSYVTCPSAFKCLWLKKHKLMAVIYLNSFI